jgi:hypothetical protein
LPESLKILNCIQNVGLKNLDNLPNTLNGYKLLSQQFIAIWGYTFLVL